MRKIIPMAIAMALIGTSVQAGVSFDAQSPRTPKEVRDCLLATYLKPHATNVVEIDGAYILTQAAPITQHMILKVTASPTPTGSRVVLEGYATKWANNRRIPKIKACAGL